MYLFACKIIGGTLRLPDYHSELKYGNTELNKSGIKEKHPAKRIRAGCC
jgi:hypothetical protein